ncbi:MAG: hypothetical protein COU29_01520 [Candidatus Magasanikbacteria bacterium CG10_big_fil_rev_8_21_14_0_10_36_32]|uniref:Uncharacterized protein n=1 Tax=Candidatus Magasanikbacteria bacterium CG10_big_fil_rev_8_21_14_0_10_36_32 TaxID=1974646 RepID=A0A2M6W6N3_9BACT|nr:MAG: hypothetical protein COU29_01520 [Candidatus Magasanikbacteria bacterium CG10_big_fil_rev_8_21_14_0_10_36_32]
MSFFSVFFGGSAGKYSNQEKIINEQEIHRLFNSIHLPNVSENEENTVEKAVLLARHSDGKISLRKIFETLRYLEKSKKISKNDRIKLMKVFENYFSQHFS